MLLKIFSKRLADSMELNGKKQIDVARELGIPKSTLSRYLKGSYEPKTERVYQLSEYFGVTPEWLMGYTNDPQGHVMVNNTDMGKQVYSINDDTFLITEKKSCSCKHTASMNNCSVLLIRFLIYQVKQGKALRWLELRRSKYVTEDITWT